MRKACRILTILLLCGGIAAASSKVTRPSNLDQSVRPLSMGTTDLKSDLEERSHLQRASRASSERSAVVSASTATTSSTIPPPPPSSTTTKPTSQPPATTVPKKVTASTTTEEPTTTEAPAEETTDTTVAEEQVAPEKPALDCGPGKKSWDHAKACYYPLIQRYPWPQARAFAILYCESTGDPNARNGSHWGLMQLDTGPYWDPAKNIEVAYNAYYKPRGTFSKWAC